LLISDDGATILKLLDIVHPAARTLVDIARAQDAEVGDGTTSVTLLWVSPEAKLTEVLLKF
jgi:T-complex protein 1 subunit eta